MEQLLQDVRFGIRALARTPGFTLVAVTILALGIGVNVSIFTVANAWLFRPIDAADPGRVVRVYSNQFSNTRARTYQILRDRQTTLSAIAGYQFTSFGVRIDQETEQHFGEMVSGDFFPLLGVTAGFGRVLRPADDRADAPPVTVLSHVFWAKRFGASRDVIGRSIALNGRPFTIVGVAPPGFTGPLAPISGDLWVPLASDAVLRPALDPSVRLDAMSLQIIGRLKPGVHITQAQAELDGIGREVRAADGVTADSPAISVYPATTLPPEISRAVEFFAAAVLTLGGIVLIIVCVNVANLVLARSAGRNVEMAVRQALGAGRRRLIRQLVTENLLLAGAGAAGGVLLALWSTRALMAMRLPTPVPMELSFPVDIRVLAFTAGAALVATVVFGLAPALGASRLDLVGALKDTQSAPRHRRLRTTFLVAQVSMSVLLLIVAGLFIRSFQSARTIDLGFDARPVLTASLDLDAGGYSPDRAHELLQQLSARLRTSAGIVSSSVIDYVPLTLSNTAEHWLRDGDPPLTADRPPLTPLVYENRIGPDYFKTMQIPLLAGRDFTYQDDDRRPRVAIVNETMASTFWPDRNPLGQRLRLAGANVQPAGTIEVVGVARDSKYVSVGEPSRPFLYLAFAQNYEPRLSLLIRTTSATPASASPLVREAVRALDPALPLFNLQTMADATSISLLAARFTGQLLAALGLAALVLAALGIYGVLSFIVRTRAREIGLRLAIGATPRAVATMIVRQAMVWTIAGAAIGVTLALLLTRVLASALYGVSPNDPATLIGVTALLSAVACVAALLPARRASRLDPLKALRER
jgi:predicted permease